MLQALDTSDYSDIYLFSHGWNNDWDTATARYEHFMKGYAGLRAELKLGYKRPYKPLLIGVFWPSTALVLPSEEAPDMAADEPLASVLADLAAEMPQAQRGRFGELMSHGGSLDDAQAQELATLLVPLWNRFQQAGTAKGDVPIDPIAASELLALWRPAQESAEDDDEYGGLADSVSSRQPGAAFSFGDLLSAPRDLLRAFTVLQMKDRAVRVGGSGVSSLLRDVAKHSAARGPADAAARMHLIGHSYGCIVMLSALVSDAPGALPRKVDSVLLLQAAVSRLCFAGKVPGKSYPGGYRAAFANVTQPLLATYTKRDGPLRYLFHMAVRRDEDLGQPVIAGAPSAPSKYAALGGYGPDGCGDVECKYQPIHGAGETYVDLGKKELRLIALEADEVIRGHGEISVPETWWALYSQVSQG